MSRVYFKDKCSTCGRDITSDEQIYYYHEDIFNRYAVCSDCVEDRLIGDSDIDIGFDPCSVPNEYCSECPHDHKCAVHGKKIPKPVEFEPEYYFVSKGRLIQLLYAENIRKAIGKEPMIFKKGRTKLIIESLKHFDVNKELEKFRKEKK